LRQINGLAAKQGQFRLNVSKTLPCLAKLFAGPPRPESGPHITMKNATPVASAVKPTHDTRWCVRNCEKGLPRERESKSIASRSYDEASAALAEAKAVDEAKGILVTTAALCANAKQAKNRDLEADAIEIRMRPTRRLDELRRAQKETLGLNSGAAGGGEKDGPRESPVNPRDLRPTLSSQGIDKHLAHAARVLGEPSEEKFEEKDADARAAASRGFKATARNAVHHGWICEAGRTRRDCGRFQVRRASAHVAPCVRL
jgi:hypothetical protein